MCCLLKPKHSFVPQFQFGVIFNLGMTLDILGKGKERKTKEAVHLIDSVSGGESGLLRFLIILIC